MKLCAYCDVIEKAVSELSASERNWKWSWKRAGIFDEKILLHWAYLDRIGRKSDFELTFSHDGLESWLSANMDCDVIDDNPVVTIGSSRWADAKTIEEAIPMMVKLVARIAHARY